METDKKARSPLIYALEGLALLAILALVTIGGRWLLANGTGAGPMADTPTATLWPSDTPSPSAEGSLWGSGHRF